MMKLGGSRKGSGNQAAANVNLAGSGKSSHNSSLNSGGFISESDGGGASASESDVPLSAEEVKQKF
jgi:hypothetical protein